VSNLLQAIWIELLKARRSKIPWLTALGFAFAPLAGGFFMVVLKDPVLARRVGLISAKAQIVAGSADWPTYLGVLAQAAAMGGLILFSFIASWVFGREFSDRTVKDLLSLPTPRYSIVIAKFMVVMLWSLGVTMFMLLVGYCIGAAVRLPPVESDIVLQGTTTIIVTALLTMTLATPIAFFASAGRGYLAPIGVALLAMVMAQLVIAVGWGEYFPWSVAALRAGMAGPQFTNLHAISYVIVILTSVIGVIATAAWWELADQAR